MKTQAKNTATENHLQEKQTDKNQTWENNHALITRAVDYLVREHERMPTKSEIAEQTGLSRKTVYRHFKELGEHALIEDHMEQFSTLASRVLASIAELAMEGDIRAARLSLELMGISKRRPQDNLKKI